MSERTRRFGFTALTSQYDTVAIGGYRFGVQDRQLLDRLLAYAAESHVHDGASAAATTTLSGPFVTVAYTGGHLPAGSEVFYRYSLVDARGHETRSSAPTRVALPPQAPPPRKVVVQAQPGTGSLPPGTYAYALSAYTGDSHHETPATPTTLVTLSATGRIEITGPSSPQGGEDGYNVYRRGPQDADFGYVGNFDLATGALHDDGTITADAMRHRPTGNTTRVNCSCTISLTDAPADYTWRLYRTYDQYDWVNSLLATGSTEPVTDVGQGTQSGSPHDADISVSSPPKLALTDAASFTGALPSGKVVFYLDVIFDFDGPLTAGEGQRVWVNEYRHAVLLGARATLDREAVADTGSITATVQHSPDGSAWTEATPSGHRPVVELGTTWGALSLLTTPETLDQGDALVVDILSAADTDPVDSGLQVILHLLVGGGFAPADDTISHEWSS